MATKRILLTAGTSWTVPVDGGGGQITVQLVGGGGGGQRCLGNAIGGKGGGGGGAYTTTTVGGVSTPGAVYTYAVGAGGSGGSSPGNATAGGQTSWTGSGNSGIDVTANPGQPGSVSTGTGGGPGGTATSPAPFGQSYAGGAGGAGPAARGGGGGGGSTATIGVGGNGGGAGNNGGSGGGGGGGVGANGQNSSSSAGSTGGDGGDGTSVGTGGTGGVGGGGGGQVGTVGGGGGGGGGRNATTTNPAGGGAIGSTAGTNQVNQTWNGSSYAASSFVGFNGSGGGGGGGQSNLGAGNGAGGAAGGLYGGGGGGGGGGQSASGPGGSGAQGAILVTYTTIANRTLYWVGGAGTWSTTNNLNWSLTSGGVGGEPPPTSADDAVFDANSGSGSINVTGGPPCRDWITTGSSFTFVFSSTSPNINRNLTFSSTTIVGGTILLTASGTWTTNGASINAISQTAACTLTLGSDLTVTTITFASSSSAVACNFVLNSYYIIARSTFSMAGTNILRTIDWGTGGFRVAPTTTNASMTIGSGANLIQTGTPRIEFVGSASRTMTFTQTAPQISASVQNIYVSGPGTFNANNLVALQVDFTGFTGAWSPTGFTTLYGPGVLKFTSGMTHSPGVSSGVIFNLNGDITLTSAGKLLTSISSAGTEKLTLADNLTLISGKTFTLSSGSVDLNNFNLNCASFSSSNSTARTITMGSGTVTLTGTSTVWDCATSTNLTVNAEYIHYSAI
jgi:hypothetical protein